MLHKKCDFCFFWHFLFLPTKIMTLFKLWNNFFLKIFSFDYYCCFNFYVTQNGSLFLPFALCLLLYVYQAIKNKKPNKKKNIFLHLCVMNLFKQGSASAYQLRRSLKLLIRLNALSKNFLKRVWQIWARLRLLADI